VCWRKLQPQYSGKRRNNRLCRNVKILYKNPSYDNPEEQALNFHSREDQMSRLMRSKCCILEFRTGDED
jgi:hypothetical protein